VYGLGADATNGDAIRKIYHAKGRPSDNPLIAHVGKYEQLKEIVEFVPAYVKKLIHQFSPGPITYILKHNGVCSNEVTAGLDTIAVEYQIIQSLYNYFKLVNFQWLLRVQIYQASQVRLRRNMCR